MRVRATLKMIRSGDVRARLSAFRDGQAAVRVAIMGAALDSGVLDRLRQSPGTTDELFTGAGLTDRELFEGFLHVLDAAGHITDNGDTWQLTKRGRSALTDDVVRATYEGFSDYHVGLYRELSAQLRGGPPRRDVVDKADVIARLSKAMEPFVQGTLTELAQERRPGSVLDVGCGTGELLAQMLEAAPGATGVGIETDAAAVALAEQTLDRRGVADRARVLNADVRDVVHDPVAIGGTVDVALLANVIYYLPMAERVPTLRAVADLLSPGGALVVVTTALTDALFSRHFDLLLRAQEGQMELPDIDTLLGQLREAGLEPGKPQRIAPGEPLTAIVATRA